MKGGGKTICLQRKKKRSNNHLMEKFSQPHALVQELKALGEGCPYQACCCPPRHIHLASFCFWPTFNPAEDSHLRHVHWAFTTAKFSQGKSDLNTLQTLTGREELPRSIPAGHLPTPGTTVNFQKSNLFAVFISQIVLKPRRLEGRQRHKGSFPFLLYSSSCLFFATLEAEHA